MGDLRRGVCQINSGYDVGMLPPYPAKVQRHLRGVSIPQIIIFAKEDKR